jgi:mannose-6-phosphate isomerase-like protein (cupin superfamily)
MSYVRLTRAEAFEPTGFPGYTMQLLAHPESATFINSRVAAGGHAADRHIHDADQIYFVVEGEMQVELGESRHVAGVGSLVYIPAGLPHRNWNPGPGTEFHFEIIVPSARPGVPLMTLVDTSAERAAGVRDGYVVTAAAPSGPEATSRRLTASLRRLTASPSRADVSICDEPPDSPAAGLHTHDFDQFYYLLRGSLSVRVGETEHVAGERTLVMLPAGIPHGSANRSGAAVRYLVVNIPGRMGSGDQDVA